MILLVQLPEALITTLKVVIIFWRNADIWCYFSSLGICCLLFQGHHSGFQDPLVWPNTGIHKINCQTKDETKTHFDNVYFYRNVHGKSTHKFHFRENVTVSGVKTSFRQIVEGSLGITSGRKKVEEFLIKGSVIEMVELLIGELVKGQL